MVATVLMTYGDFFNCKSLHTRFDHVEWAGQPATEREPISLALTATQSLLLSPRFPSDARDFFTLSFPPLLQRIFGFQQLRHDPPPSDCWLSSASDDASKSLLSLLHPSGPLFSCFSKVEQHRLPLFFFFPSERLPQWVRRALMHAHGPSNLLPIFRDRIKLDSDGSMRVQLDVFEYFFFWFAYYPLCATADNEDARIQESAKKESANSVLKSVQNGSLPNWIVHGRRQAQQQQGSIHVDPYLQLLQLYLAHFVTASVSQSPVQDFQRRQSSEMTGRGDFLVNTLMGFWFTENDSTQVSGFVPPNTRLLLALRIFVNHINTVDGKSSTPICPQQLPMQLYKLLRRAFLSWTAASPINKISEFVDIWSDYLQPWALEQGSLVEKHSGSLTLYSDRWQSFVSANYLFYTSLTLHFFEFSLKHMHINPDMVLLNTAKILDVLAGSPTLLNYLKELHAMVKSWKLMAPKVSTAVVSTIQEQLQTWECGNFSENGLQPGSSQLRFFGTDGNDDRQVFQMLILRAENEIGMIPDEGTYAKCSKALNSIKASGNVVFGIGKPDVPPHISTSSDPVQSSQLFVARTQHTWLDVKYKGDWMKRPIESTEVAWLVRSLVSLSDIINAWLDMSRTPSDRPKCISNEIPSPDDVSNKSLSSHNAADNAIDPKLGCGALNVSESVYSSARTAWLILHQYVQRRGWRVNLRFLAKKPIAFIVFLILTHFLKKAVLGISKLV